MRVPASGSGPGRVCRVTSHCSWGMRLETLPTCQGAALWVRSLAGEAQLPAQKIARLSQGPGWAESGLQALGKSHFPAHSCRSRGAAVCLPALSPQGPPLSSPRGPWSPSH